MSYLHLRYYFAFFESTNLFTESFPILHFQKIFVFATSHVMYDFYTINIVRAEPELTNKNKNIKLQKKFLKFVKN